MLGFFKLIQPINDDIHANHERVRLLDKPCCIKNTLRLVVQHPNPFSFFIQKIIAKSSLLKGRKE